MNHLVSSSLNGPCLFSHGELHSLQGEGHSPLTLMSFFTLLWNESTEQFLTFLACIGLSSIRDTHSSEFQFTWISLSLVWEHPHSIYFLVSLLPLALPPFPYLSHFSSRTNLQDPQTGGRELLHPSSSKNSPLQTNNCQASVQSLNREIHTFSLICQDYGCLVFLWSWDASPLASCSSSNSVVSATSPEQIHKILKLE